MNKNQKKLRTFYERGRVWLKDWREKNAYSLETAAEILQISKRSVSRYESGELPITFEILFWIAMDSDSSPIDIIRQIDPSLDSAAQEWLDAEQHQEMGVDPLTWALKMLPHQKKLTSMERLNLELSYINREMRSATDEEKDDLRKRQDEIFDQMIAIRLKNRD